MRKNAPNSNSFGLGCKQFTTQSPYQTMSSIIHNHKGDSSLVMGKLDVEKKKDLRKNHFEIGGISANVTNSTYTNVNRPISAQERRDAR